MKRLILAQALPLCAAAGLAGCYADYTPGPAYAGGTVTIGALPIGMPPAVSVSMAPPPPRYESPLGCGIGEAYVPGRWDWNGSWYWQNGACMPQQAGYVYVAPQYSNGVYVRGHWAPSGSGGVYGAPPPPPPPSVEVR